MRRVFDDDDIEDGQLLWRYFRADRLIESIVDQSLYFPAARQFEDRFEGATAIVPPEYPQDPRFAGHELGERAFEELRGLTKISSWHRADFESQAMWRLYGAHGKGVAIRSTPERLKEALQPFRLRSDYGEERPYWGNVRYVNLQEERLRVSMLKRFFYKHRAFEWEREFRVAISLRSAEEYGVTVPERGIRVTCAMDTLIESVIAGPEIDRKGHEAISETLDHHGLGRKYKKSSLLGRPRYT